MTFDSFDVDIEYYISAEANNGKVQSKPITAQLDVTRFIMALVNLVLKFSVALIY